MKAGLVWRGFPEKSRVENYLERFASALSAAGHSLVVYTSQKNNQAGGFQNVEIRTVGQTAPRAFADALAELRSRNECDFLLSIEPVWDCDCYLALNGVHRTRLEEWKRINPPAWHWLKCRRDKSTELLALEKKAFLSGFAKNVVVGSKMVKEQIVRHFDFPPNRIAVVYEGIAPPLPGHAAMRDETRRELGLSPEDYVILCGGPGLQECEYRFAIEGINRTNLSQPVLLVTSRKKQWAYPRSRRTRFVEEKLEMARLFAAADVFLMPLVMIRFQTSASKRFPPVCR